MKHLIKKFILFVIKILIYPFTKKVQPYMYIKSTYFSDINDHFYQSVAYLKNNYIIPEVVFDIGASRGAFSILIAKSFPKCNVYAFEPIPSIYEELKQKSSAYPNIKHSLLAIANSEAHVEFYVTNNYDSSSLLNPNNISYEGIKTEKKIQTRQSTIDNQSLRLGIEKICLLKMDIQGAELLALQGANNMLSKTRFVLTEMSIQKQYEASCSYDELDGFLREKKFRLIGLFARTVGINEYDALYENTQL